jgi:hypothetical protein
MIGAVTQGAEQGKDWLAFALAVYGAIVASSVALYQFLRDRPGVRVFLMWTEIVINDEDFPVQLWQVKVVNHRKRPITMEEGGLILNTATRPETRSWILLAALPKARFQWSSRTARLISSTCSGLTSRRSRGRLSGTLSASDTTRATRVSIP